MTTLDPGTAPTVLTDHVDIGTPSLAGSVRTTSRELHVSAAGANIWGLRDELHFVWVLVTGDFSLEAVAEFLGTGIDPHRKAVVMARASLDDDAPYIDLALHGDGLVSVQYRAEAGGDSAEVRSPRVGARALGLRRHGAFFSGWADGAPAAGMVRVELPDELYVGIGVSSHRADVVETVAFSDIALEVGAPSRDRLFSVLETFAPESGARSTVRVFDRWVEAPNWTRDDILIVNGDGYMHAVPVTGDRETRIDTGDVDRCNNDHGLSPDGTLLAISDSRDDDGSRIYLVPVEGGEPALVSRAAPSFWHGWSPDGSRLAFTGQRDGVWGIFDIALDGSGERRLTTAPGLDDGPEYSPDGAWIYFNSDRTGVMQIHRIPVDGGEAERVTDDDTADWFPHIAPDGRRMVVVAYAGDVQGHPRDKEVGLVLHDLTDGSSRRLVDLFGGQGTMNVPAWAPDGSRFAFMSYVYG